jgi:hypothetical protein
MYYDPSVSLVVNFTQEQGWFICRMAERLDPIQTNIACTVRPNGSFESLEPKELGNCTYRRWQLCVAKLATLSCTQPC